MISSDLVKLTTIFTSVLWDLKIFLSFLHYAYIRINSYFLVDRNPWFLLTQGKNCYS